MRPRSGELKDRVIPFAAVLCLGFECGSMVSKEDAEGIGGSGGRERGEGAILYLEECLGAGPLNI